MRQDVVLLTSDLGDGAETVVGIEVNGERFEVPYESRIAVIIEAGAGLSTVTVTLFANTVRYAPDPTTKEPASTPPSPATTTSSRTRRDPSTVTADPAK